MPLPDETPESPPLPSAGDPTEALVRALQGLEPRQAQLLEHRFIRGKSDAEVASHYGMSAEAYAVHLLRAARAFAPHAAPTQGEPSLAVEERLGLELVNGLAHPEAATAAVFGLVRALGPLAGNASRLKTRLEELAMREASSPAAHRENLIRRIAVGVLLAVTIYLYFTRSGF